MLGERVVPLPGYRSLMGSPSWRKVGLYFGLVDPFDGDEARRDRAYAEKTVADIVLIPLAAAVVAGLIIGVLDLLFGSSARSAIENGVGFFVIVGAATIVGGFVRRRQARRRLYREDTGEAR